MLPPGNPREYYHAGTIAQIGADQQYPVGLRPRGGVAGQNGDHDFGTGNTLARRYRLAGPVTEVSPGQNAETEPAIDGRFVYVVWVGCGGIGFARSTNDSRSFGKPFLVPG